jgi:hypothetical protein
MGSFEWSTASGAVSAVWLEWLQCLVDRQFGKGVGGRGSALCFVNRPWRP